MAEQGDMSIDDGASIHYRAVERRTPVYAADGTEVRRTAERGVTLSIGAEEVAELGPPPKGASSGLLGSLFGGWP